MSVLESLKTSALHPSISEVGTISLVIKVVETPLIVVRQFTDIGLSAGEYAYIKRSPKNHVKTLH